MQNSLFYIAKSLISNNPDEKILDKYTNVKLQDEKIKVKNLLMNVTTHRILLYTQGEDAFLIDGHIINQVTITEDGFLWNKKYFLTLMTNYGKINFTMINYKQAQITISSMVKNKQWTKQPKIQQTKKPTLYSGILKKIQQQKIKIDTNAAKVDGSFNSFQSLFGNLNGIKQAMKQMKKLSKQQFGQNSQINKILKDIGFVQVISKQQAGGDFIRKLATSLFTLCNQSLFNKYGGIVSLLDLFYIYNKKLTTQLVSPDQLLQACQKFGTFGFNAKLVNYPNNIKMIQSTLFDQKQDFQRQFQIFFKNYKNGYSAEEIANKKNLPLTIVEIKLKKACKRGVLALDSRIQGIRYYKNLLLTI